MFEELVPSPHDVDRTPAVRATDRTRAFECDSKFINIFHKSCCGFSFQLYFNDSGRTVENTQTFFRIKARLQANAIVFKKGKRSRIFKDLGEGHFWESANYTCD
jgi:hypothetical protein